MDLWTLFSWNMTQIQNKNHENDPHRRRKNCDINREELETFVYADRLRCFSKHIMK